MTPSPRNKGRPARKSASAATPRPRSEPGPRPGAQSLNPEVLDSLRRTTYRAVSAAHLRQEYEDQVQEALVRFCQMRRQRPGQPLTRYLAESALFTRNQLRRGKSVDSPKRRALGHSIDPEPCEEVYRELPELVSEVDPAQEASARDAVEQLMSRLAPQERTILLLLLERNGTREIARKLKTSHSVVCRAHSRIRSAALKIGLYA